MDGYSAALGRGVGKVDTDSGGLARYSLKLHTPPAINRDVEPEISLEYCQGCPNGSLGVGWALGGISCIRRAPSNLAYDGMNPPPANYDRSEPKLTLDGAELLMVEGDYGAQNAKYTTEFDHNGRTIESSDSGFVVSDSTGARAEYGTSDDSRILGSDGKTIREWRLKRKSDYHGNSVIYNYVVSPQTDGSKSDVNTCYISSIRYNSNAKTGYEGKRLIRFEYSPRADKVVQVVQGTYCTWASLLTAIRFGVLQGDSFLTNRSYELEYETSKNTGDSCLKSVTEIGLNHGQKTKLTPSTFGYTSPEVLLETCFSTSAQPLTTLTSTTNNIALFPLNISGRCLSDLACVRYNSGTKELTLKTYLATTNDDGSIGWTPSTTSASVASLPTMDLEVTGFPNILTPDLSNDGRADFVVPYKNRDSNVAFSISQSVGTGFQSAIIMSTKYKWTDGAKFLVMDNPGRGPSLVQILTDRNKLTFRNFPTIIRDDRSELQDAVATVTNYENTGNIDWLQLNHAGTGARSLVRVWEDRLPMGNSQMKATVFTMTQDNSLKEGPTSSLGEPVRTSKTKYSVLSCDINADGAQDIILGSAEWSGDQVTLTFSTYLGDGYGEFKAYSKSTTRTITADTPLNASDSGQFHTTNLNGSNYPTLSYVYQTKYSKSYVCISVDGRGDGTLSQAVRFTLAEKLSLNKSQISAADLNGNSMGDWLFYTLDQDTPRVLPVYNRSKVVDLLSWAQDSMGLRTDLTYGCLSDPKVYDPGLKWDTYRNDMRDGYPVIAGPNYVVTKLEHRNVSSVNSFDYNVVVKKTYKEARINHQGRGWQGFREINTLNDTDGILTTETYLQEWPFTGSKSRIDTKTRDGKTLKSVKSEYQKSSKLKGAWNVYRVDRTLEQTDMLEDSIVARSIATKYAYDENGNMILRSPSERQRNQLMSQSWDRCSYTTIDGVKNVLTAQKLSTKEDNTDMTIFEPGDVSFKKYENDTLRAVLKSVLTWSSDVQSFSKKTYKIDDYGREAMSLEPSGLERTITYDDVFQTFPVKITEVQKSEQGNRGISVTQLTSFDIHNGMETARREKTGLLSCFRIDSFGRTIETRTRAAERGNNTTTVADFLAECPYVADADFSQILASIHLNPQRKISFERSLSSTGSGQVFAREIQYSKEGVEGETEVVDYVDCLKQVCKRSSREGGDTKQTWVYKEYNSRGSLVYESFPVKSQVKSGSDWVPDKNSGVRSVMDILDRPISRVRPAHGQQTRFIVSTMTYLDGGARVVEKNMNSGSSTAPFINAVQLSQLERRCIQMEREVLVVENLDENGLRSKFEYDARGRMTQGMDAAGRVEVRSYNSQGQIIALDNPYQNTSKVIDTPAVKYEYNLANQLVRETNAAGESMSYQRDAKGRMLLKTGRDGRTIKCVYDQEGFEALSSVAVYPQGSDRPFESLLELAYDQCGRIKQKKLTLADSSVFTTSMRYNWQGQIVQKVLPNDVTLTQDYRGTQVASSILSSGSTSSWAIAAETTGYSAFGRPETLTVGGSGIRDSFTHSWEYDSQGFPLAHRLSVSGKSLVDERYMYNDMDQLGRKHDFLLGVTTDYTYQGRRLSSSQVGSGTKNSYIYDTSGNLTGNRGTELVYSASQVKGMVSDTSVFDITYDGVGRMNARNTSRSALKLSYDSFGAVNSIIDTKNDQKISLVADHNGEMLQRKQSDGSSDLFLSEDVSIHLQADGSQLVRYHLLSETRTDNKTHNIATVSVLYESKESTKPLGGTRRLNLQFSDTKGNVTHVFSAEDANLRQKLDYDDFGRLDDDIAENLQSDDVQSTYEGNYLDKLSGLLNFGARWYDPLVGRFTTPDNILDIDSLLRTDGLNRYVFENNDPINNHDPTGHWTWSSVLGFVVAAVLVVAAVALTVATAGAGGILMGALIGALAAGGLAGMTYSLKHRDEEDAGKFWAGWGTTVGINAAIGAATGAAGAWASPARMASTAARIAINAAAGGASSVLSKAAERGVENLFYGKSHNLWEGWEMNLATGALLGGALAARGQKPNEVKGAFGPQPNNAFQRSYANFQTLEASAKVMGKITAKLVVWNAKESGLDKELMLSMGQMLHDLTPKGSPNNSYDPYNHHRRGY